MSYYTPSIDEFHFGFEYEYTTLGSWSSYLTESNDWLKQTFTYGTDWEETEFEDVKHLIEEKKLRVKYLDKSDIVSLGWEFDKELKNLTEYYRSQYINRIYEENDYMYWEVFLKYNVDLKRVTITANISDGSVEEKFFEGSCRNKSELSKIMKLLNIKLTSNQ